MFKFKPSVVTKNFDGQTKSIPIKQNFSGVFRQHYVYCYKSNIFSYYDNDFSEMHDYILPKFCLPDGMSYADAFKVLSFLSEYVERKHNLPECCSTTIKEVQKLLPQFGFVIVDDPNVECTDLFTVNGNYHLFNRTAYAKEYFDWFTKNVSWQQVQEIYQKLNLPLNFEEPEAKTQAR